MTFGEVAAQASSTPPARTYHVDQYGRESKVVKERWGENASGQKHGIYLRYTTKGAPIEKFTYVNGVKNGPAFEVFDDYFYSMNFRSDKKMIGSYVNGKMNGGWKVYDLNYDGSDGSLDRVELYAAGVIKKAVIYRSGRKAEEYSFVNNKKQGPAKIYGPTEAEYASGIFANGKPFGTWINAASVSGDLQYKKGFKLVFSDGKLPEMNYYIYKDNSWVKYQGKPKNLVELWDKIGVTGQTYFKTYIIPTSSGNTFAEIGFKLFTNKLQWAEAQDTLQLGELSKQFNIKDFLSSWEFESELKNSIATHKLSSLFLMETLGIPNKKRSGDDTANDIEIWDYEQHKVCITLKNGIAVSFAKIP